MDIIMDKPLNKAALDILDTNSAPINPFGKAIQKDLAMQWYSALKSGLSQEVIQVLERKYPIPINLQSAKPPRLNPELRSLSRRNFWDSIRVFETWLKGLVWMDVCLERICQKDSRQPRILKKPVRT